MFANFFETVWHLLYTFCFADKENLIENKPMKVIIYPSKLTGRVQAAASKSSMQRACAAALLHQGLTYIYEPGRSNDDKAAIQIIKDLGAQVKDEGARLEIKSKGVAPTSHNIHCGESGLGIRMFTPIAALYGGTIDIGGDGSLIKRPMHFFDDIFPKLKVQIESNNGYLPFKITGPLRPADIEVDGSQSSQYLTGLLMAYGSVPLANSVTIRAINLKSKPYILLTLDVMKKFGMNVPEYRNDAEFQFSPIEAMPVNRIVDYTVEGDWSGAAFLLVAGAIAGPIKVSGLDTNSTQADKAMLQALQLAGVAVVDEGKHLVIHPTEIKPFEFDATDCPDLFPPLVALAAFAQGDTKIEGVSRLQHKESDRALTLQTEFKKLGIEILLDNDVMTVKGGSAIHSCTVHSHHDHRIAMACAVAALRADGPVEIMESQAINKSYPDFFNHLKSLHARIENTFVDLSKDLFD